jgi:hypothetical protein
VFVDRSQRERFNHRLAANLPMANPTTPATPAAFLKTPRPAKASARVFSGFRQDELSTAQRKWQAREISNVRWWHFCQRFQGLMAAPVHVLEHHQPDLRSDAQ